MNSTFKRKLPKPKKCEICRDKPVMRLGAKACSPECAEKYVEQQKAKKQRAEAKKQRQLDKEKKLALEPLHYFAKRAEKACNAFIRERDRGDPCISCGTYDAPVWHAGHLYTVKARPDIRYHEDNIHLQCPDCNTYNGGMVGEYKRRIVSKIGQERYDALYYVNPAFKKTREYYMAVEQEYKDKLKALLKQRQDLPHY